MNDLTYEVYFLRDPDTLEIRYVGCTTNPQGRRKRHHFPPDIPSSRVQKWTSKLKRRGKKAIYETYDVFGSDRKLALETERELVQSITKLEVDLLNVTHKPNIYPRKRGK